jgi:hypothetical protein
MALTRTLHHGRQSERRGCCIERVVNRAGDRAGGICVAGTAAGQGSSQQIEPIGVQSAGAGEVIGPQPAPRRRHFVATRLR